MDDNENTTNDEDVGSEKVTTSSVEPFSMSKTEFEKALQSAEDKVRTKYSKQVKELETKIKELSPPEKSEAEIELDNRLKSIEDKQREVEAKERHLNMQETLQSKNIDKAIADFLRDDVDVDAFESIVTNVVTDRMKATGYVPSGHPTNESISKEKWDKSSYSEKQRIYESNPELAKKFIGMH